jgi:hypothetical protein
MADPNVTSKNLAEEGYHKSYSEFSKTLRTWFVAYGIGGPIVLLSNETAWGWLVKSGRASTMGLLFLIGGAIQIISAILNKQSMWYMYFGELKPATKSRTSYKLSDWYSDQGWIDVVLDFATILLFGLATWIAFSTIMAAPAEIFMPSKS